MFKSVSTKEKFFERVLIEGYSTCISDDPECRGGKFYNKENAIKYLLGVKSTHFYTPGQFVEQETKRLQKHVQAINCLWLDYDGNQDVSKEFFDSKKLPIPSFTLRRKDRFHCYYILTNPHFLDDPVEFSQWLRKLARLAGSDSSTVATAQTYMRVPETLWQKKGHTEAGYAFVKNLSTEESHTINFFLNFVEKNYVESDFELLKKKPELVSLKKKTSENLTAIKKLIFAGQEIVNKGQGRSTSLYNTACRCWDFGLDIDSALDVLSEFNELYCNPPEDDKTVCHALDSGYRYAQGEYGSLQDLEGKDLAKELYTRKKLAVGLSDWYYILEAEQLRNPKNGKVYTTQSQIKNALASITGISLAMSNVIAKNCVKTVDRTNFLPGEKKAVIEKQYYREINSFIPLKEIDFKKTDSEAGKMFIDHIKYLTTCDMEFKHVMKWLKHIFTKPSVKIRHSLLFITEEGTGKTILYKFFEKVLCSINDLSYVTTLSSKEIIDGHNSKLDSKLLCITNELEGLVTYSSQKDFKSWITDETINIGNKYMRGYTTSNYCNFISFSNSDNAAFIRSGDRRFFVVQNRKAPKASSYYQNLYNTLENNYEEIYNYIVSYEIAELDPFAPPPMTEGKELVQELSKPELTKLLEELYDSGKMHESLGNFFTTKNFMDTVGLLLPHGSGKDLTYNKLHYFAEYKKITKLKDDFTENGKRYRITYFSLNGKKLEREQVKELHKRG